MAADSIDNPPAKASAYAGAFVLSYARATLTETVTELFFVALLHNFELQRMRREEGV